MKQHGWEFQVKGFGLGLTFTILPKRRLLAALGPITVSYGRDKA